MYILSMKPKLSKIEKLKRDPNSRYWRKKALKLWSELVRAVPKCAVCGRSDKVLNGHHILPKERYRELMFEVRNGISLCQYHHKFSKFSAHLNPVWFSEWLRVNRPEQFEWVIAHFDAGDAVITYKESWERLKLQTPPD